MVEFLLLMHNDTTRATKPAEWDRYIALLRKGHHFGGGSVVGEGVTIKGDAMSDKVTPGISGYMIIFANDMEEAMRLTKDNPCRVAGGTVEVRELPKS